MTAVDGAFRCPEAAVYWRYISSSLDRLVAIAADAPPELADWTPPAPHANSLVTLAAHVVANAEENVVAVIMGQGVVRDRAEEFSPSVSAARVSTRWTDVRPTLERSLGVLDPARLDQAVSHPRRGTLTVREVLLVVARHAAEHLGQAELTRDLAVAAHAT